MKLIHFHTYFILHFPKKIFHSKILYKKSSKLLSEKSNNSVSSIYIQTHIHTSPDTIPSKRKHTHPSGNTHVPNSPFLFRKYQTIAFIFVGQIYSHWRNRSVRTHISAWQNVTLPRFIAEVFRISCTIYTRTFNTHIKPCVCMFAIFIAYTVPAEYTLDWMTDKTTGNICGQNNNAKTL